MSGRSRRSRHPWHYIGAGAWILLTLSMATWWMIFGIEQAKRLDAIGHPQTAALGRIQRMFVGEGATFIALLLAGGVGLLVSVRREHVRQREIEAFFMAFTHDLKTSIASLQLQVESLIEDWPGADKNPSIDRLLKDSRRLQLQLENSLYFAEPEGGLYVEALELRPFVERIAADWPELQLTINGDGRAMVDSRALESVLRNVFQNAILHGQAKKMTMAIDAPSPGRVTVTATDDGRGAPEEIVATLGRPFGRPTALSGTGMGLFVSSRLVERMKGDLRFATSPGNGFTATLELMRQ